MCGGLSTAPERGSSSSCLQAPDAWGDHPVEPRLRPRWHRHPGGGGEEAEEGEGHDPPRPGPGGLHRGGLEVEERVSRRSGVENLSVLGNLKLSGGLLCETVSRLTSPCSASLGLKSVERLSTCTDVKGRHCPRGREVLVHDSAAVQTTARSSRQSNLINFAYNVIILCHQVRVWVAIASCLKICLFLYLRDIPSLEYPPRCMLDRSVSQPTQWTVANVAYLSIIYRGKARLV